MIPPREVGARRNLADIAMGVDAGLAIDLELGCRTTVPPVARLEVRESQILG